jgi:hypothetical protein
VAPEIWRLRSRPWRSPPILVCSIGIATAILVVALPVGVTSAAPTQWADTSTPSASSGAGLSGVSCVTSTDCIAVGGTSRDSPAAGPTLVQTWNGSTWSVIPSPSPGTRSNVLDSISCADASFCVAVGDYQNNGGGIEALIENWDGVTWSVDTFASPLRADEMLGVSCVRPTDCVAVGYEGAFGSFQTLIETWDGSVWSLSPGPNPGPNDELSNVSCVSATDCVAVGSVGTLTLIERWDGTTWSVDPSPDPSTTSNHLSGISCVNVRDCVAVGQYANGQIEQTLVETWDGTAWSVVDTPNPGTGVNQLTSVSCVKSTDCVAVGNDRGSDSSSTLTLMESWDGTSWSTDPSSSPDTENQLDAVSCVSSHSCVTVGDHANGSVNDNIPGGGIKTLAEIGSECQLPPIAPEAPVTLALPVSALVVIGGFVAIRHRRLRSPKG